MPRPRTYDDRLRARLVTGAAEAIADGGVDAMSLRQVAARAGTSTSAVYALFGGRSQLVGAVVAAASDGFTQAQESAAGPTADPVADLVALGHAYRRWALENPALYAVMFGGRVPIEPGPDGDPPASIVPLLHAVTRAQQAGAIVVAPVDEVARSIWASVHGWVSLEVAGCAGPAPSGSYDRHLHAIADGWASPPG